MAMNTIRSKTGALTALLVTLTACGASSPDDPSVGLNSSVPTSVVEARFRNEPITAEWLGVATQDAISYEISACYRSDRAGCFLIYRIDCPAEMGACKVFAARDLQNPMVNYALTRHSEEGGLRFRFQDLRTPSVGSSLVLKIQGVQGSVKGQEIFAIETPDLGPVKSD